MGAGLHATWVRRPIFPAPPTESLRKLLATQSGDTCLFVLRVCDVWGSDGEPQSAVRPYQSTCQRTPKMLALSLGTPPSTKSTISCVKSNFICDQGFWYQFSPTTNALSKPRLLLFALAGF